MRLLSRMFLLVSVLPVMVAQAGPNIKKLDLTAHFSKDKADIVEKSPGLFEWSLPTPLPQTIHFDFNKLGIDPAQYDELRFDIQPQGSQVDLHSVLHGFPTPNEFSSWYLKFKTPIDKWTRGRFDLRVDDDGAFGPRTIKLLPANTFEMTLSRRIVGFPGEPAWRKVLIRNPRLVRSIVTTSFSPLDVKLSQTRNLITYSYFLKVRNRTDNPLCVTLDPDSRKTLKYFKAEAPVDIELNAEEEKIVSIKLSISRSKAETLPPLYCEPAIPQINIPNIPDSDHRPFIGFSDIPMWAVIPIFIEHHPSPVETMSYLAAREKAMPVIKKWRERVLRDAEKAMGKDWPVHVGLTVHTMLYRCKKCGVKLRPVDERRLDKHYCPKCGKHFENDPTMSGAYAGLYRSARFQDIYNLSLAYQLTGKDTFAKKAVEMFDAYALKYPEMPIKGWRSTAAGSKLGGSNTLFSAWSLSVLAEAFHYLNATPVLSVKKRERITNMLKEEAFRIYRHSVMYTNMQAEHIRAYGSVGLVTGCWPLVGEAINGEFGWHQMVEFGYTEDGIGQEAGAYHRSLFGAMVKFSNFAYEMGANLLTPRFKRVFDGSLAIGATKGISYELAYRVYRDNAYLPLLHASRSTFAQELRQAAAFFGILGIPETNSDTAKSKLFTSTGYVFLRQGANELRLNYIKTFDRLEHDKFQTRFFHAGKPIDVEVGRMPYHLPKAGWMEATPAHSAVAVDGGDQRDVDGQLVSFADNIAVVKTDPKSPLYKGVSQIRGVALIGDCFVVFDRLDSDTPHCFDRYQYGQGQATITGASSPKSTLDFLPTLGRFENIHSSLPCTSGEFAFANGLKGKIVSDQNFTLNKATTVKGFQPTPCDVVFARARGKEATFLSVFGIGKLPELKIVKSSPEEMVFQIGAHKIRILPEAGKTEVN